MWNDIFSKIKPSSLLQRLNDDGGICSSLYKMQKTIQNIIALLLRHRLFSPLLTHLKQLTQASKVSSLLRQVHPMFIHQPHPRKYPHLLMY